MGQAVLSLIRTYPVRITYEDPRYEYSGDLHGVTRPLADAADPQVRAIVPRGGVLQATYEASMDTGAPVDMADAIQGVVDASNLARNGGHFELRQSGDTFHVVPKEVRDGQGRWIAQQSILDAPITFSSGGERDGFELIEAVLREVSVASGQKIVAGRAVANGCGSRGCAENRRTVDAHDEPAREVLVRLVRSLSARYTWVLYYDPSARCYRFNLVLGVERSEPEIEHDRPATQPGNPTPAQPFNLASAR